MDPQSHRRIQRDGWDLAVEAYEAHWRAPLAPRPGYAVLAEFVIASAVAPGQSTSHHPQRSSNA
jgi:hypothetical protein